MSTFHAPAPVDKTRTYWSSSSERTDSKKLCACGAPVKNYDQYNRHLRSTLIGCCCNATTCTTANMYDTGLCSPMFSSSSIRFGENPSNSYITFLTSTPVVLDGDFTIEWFQYLTGSHPYPHLFSEVAIFPYATDTYFACSVEGGLYFTFLGTQYSFGGYTSYTNLQDKWVHFAIVRKNGNLYAYMNGVKLSPYYSNNGSVTLVQTMIGNIWGGGANEQFIGYINSFRIVKDTAVYTESFNAPTCPLTDIPGTQILLLAKTAATVANNSASAQSPTSTQPSGTITWSPAF